MSLRHFLENVPSRVAAAFSLTLLLIDPTIAQQIPLDDTVRPENPPAASEPTAKTERPQAKDPGEQPTNTAGAGNLKPWTVRCGKSPDKPSNCLMSQALANRQTGKRLIAVSIRKQPQGMSMVLAMPHGLYLPGGISYQVDSGQKKSIPIAASDEKGVYAAIPMDDTLMGAMKRGNTFVITLASGDRRPMAIPVTLSGFTAAAAELAAAK